MCNFDLHFFGKVRASHLPRMGDLLHQTLQKTFTIFLFLFFLLPKLSPFRMQQNPKPNSNTQQSIYFSPSSVSIFHPTTSPSMPCPSSFPYHFPPPITYTGNISTRACAADKQYTIVHVHTQTIRMGKLFKNSLFPGTPGK